MGRFFFFIFAIFGSFGAFFIFLFVFGGERTHCPRV